MKKDADEKSDDDGERLATASERALLFEGPSFIATTDAFGGRVPPSIFYRGATKGSRRVTEISRERRNALRALPSTTRQTEEE